MGESIIRVVLRDDDLPVQNVFHRHVLLDGCALNLLDGHQHGHDFGHGSGINPLMVVLGRDDFAGVHINQHAVGTLPVLIQSDVGRVLIYYGIALGKTRHFR